jgi:hypothetical protein
VAPFPASISKILSVGKLKATIQIHYLWTLIIDSSRKLITVILEKSEASDAEGTKLPGYIVMSFSPCGKVYCRNNQMVFNGSGMHRSGILSGEATSNCHGNSPLTIPNHLVAQHIAIISKIPQMPKKIHLKHP